MNSGRENFRAGLLLCMTCAIIAVAGTALPFVAAPARIGEPVLVLAPPWNGGASAIVADAGGRVIGPTQAPFAVLAVFDAVKSMDTLRLDGSWGVFDGRRIALACGAIEDA
jgi:hypothetical protein